ncbi:MAG: hypothetical protein R3A13_00470 [Bdellovibrionota bacterium]
MLEEELLLGFEFVEASAVEYEPETPVDILVIRNQNIAADKEVWIRLFYNGIKNLKPGGKFLMTSAVVGEHDFAVKFIEQLGVRKVLDLENPDSENIPGSALTAGVDIRLALFEK